MLHLQLTLSYTGFFWAGWWRGGGGGGWNPPHFYNFSSVWEIWTKFGTVIDNRKTIKLAYFNWQMTSPWRYYKVKMLKLTNIFKNLIQSEREFSLTETYHQN